MNNTTFIVIDLFIFAGVPGYISEYRGASIQEVVMCFETNILDPPNKHGKSLDGSYVGGIPERQLCHSRNRTSDELQARCSQAKGIN